jgi:hypothetical protein
LSYRSPPPMAEWNVEIRASAVPRIVSPSSAVTGNNG